MEQDFNAFGGEQIVKLEVRLLEVDRTAAERLSHFPDDPAFDAAHQRTDQ